MRRPAEHPPVAIEDDDDFGGAADPEATEKLWDEISKHNRRQQERMQRAIEERRSRGLDAETAFRDALRDVVPDRPDEETERFDEPWRDDEHPPFGESLADEAVGLVPEPRRSVRVTTKNAIHFCNRQWTCSCDSIRSFATRTRDLLLRSARSIKAPVTRWAAWRRRCPIATHDAEDHGLRVVQLKRALRGAAFARGALFPLRSTMSKEQFDELFRRLEQMETDIVSELGKVRLI